MNKEFIPYEIADELKELGFTGGEGRYYIEDLGMCERILWQQAFRWFREKHNLRYMIDEFLEDNEVWYECSIKNSYGFIDCWQPTYEEAELACLKKLIEIVKNK